MIKIKFMLCALGVIQDVESNNISVFNIFEEFTPFGLPALIPEFSILAVFERDNNDPQNIECSFRASLTGEQLLNQNLSVDFQGRNRTRAIVRVGGLPLPRPGKLVIEMAHGELIHQYEIVVNSPPARVEQQ